MPLRHYKTLAPPKTLTVGVDDNDLVLTVGSTAGYPVAPFALTLARQTADEEVVLCTSYDATTFTVTRGYDGTTGKTHGIGTLVEHTSIALDYREAGVVRLTTSERNALAGEDIWDGRVIYNDEEDRLQVKRPSGWDSILPSGAILPYGGAAAPEGFLMCDGAAVSRTTYAALFTVLGESFGAGNGTTTFNVPDLRGRFPLGVATAGTGSTRGGTGGTIDHVHAGPSHTHGATGLTNAAEAAHTHTNPTTASGGSHSHDQGVSALGGSHAHTNPDTSSAGSHSHSFSDTSGGPSSTLAIQTLGAGSAASSSHTHSVSGTTGSGGTHDHTQASTGGASSHTHDQGTGATAAAHTHTQGATGAGSSHNHAISGATAASGTANTGTANPPFQAVNYIVRV